MSENGDETWLTLDISRPVNREGHIRAKHKSSNHQRKSDSLLNVARQFKVRRVLEKHDAEWIELAVGVARKAHYSNLFKVSKEREKKNC